MRYNFALFAPRLREACARRNVTIRELGRSVGLSPRRTFDLEERGIKGLDIERFSQIAERLEVSMDWLCGAPE